VTSAAKYFIEGLLCGGFFLLACRILARLSSVSILLKSELERGSFILRRLLTLQRRVSNLVGKIDLVEKQLEGQLLASLENTERVDFAALFAMRREISIAYYNIEQFYYERNLDQAEQLLNFLDGRFLKAYPALRASTKADCTVLDDWESRGNAMIERLCRTIQRLQLTNNSDTDTVAASRKTLKGLERIFREPPSFKDAKKKFSPRRWN